jgi:hypothetical protein
MISVEQAIAAAASTPMRRADPSFSLANSSACRS